jgi:hypothetical protein
VKGLQGDEPSITKVGVRMFMGMCADACAYGSAQHVRRACWHPTPHHVTRLTGCGDVQALPGLRGGGRRGREQVRDV